MSLEVEEVKDLFNTSYGIRSASTFLSSLNCHHSCALRGWKVACKCTVPARELFPKSAGDRERDLQSLGPLGSRLHTMTRAVCATQSAVVAESCLSWIGQDIHR